MKPTLTDDEIALHFEDAEWMRLYEDLCVKLQRCTECAALPSTHVFHDYEESIYSCGSTGCTPRVFYGRERTWVPTPWAFHALTAQRWMRERMTAEEHEGKWTASMTCRLDRSAG